jgi:divalent metal cation (Fe/Co/Zn/Cd) transporter
MQSGFQNRLISLAGINITLEGIHRFVGQVTPYLSTMLTIVQLVAGVLTVIHIFRKNRYEEVRTRRITKRARRRRGRLQSHPEES